MRNKTAKNLKGKVNESERKRERAREKDLREEESPVQEEKMNEGLVNQVQKEMQPSDQKVRLHLHIPTYFEMLVNCSEMANIVNLQENKVLLKLHGNMCSSKEKINICIC